MNRNQFKKSKKRTFQVFARNDSRFIAIHQRLLKLNLLRELPAFTTKKYDSQDYFMALEHASLHNISVKQACLMTRLQRKNYPSPEQVMKCCRNTSPTWMMEFVNLALSSQFNALPKNIRQQLRKLGIIFIDFHQDCYYGDAKNPDVRRGKVKRSTAYFYEFLTADIYSKKGSFTIAILHRKPNETIFHLVERFFQHIEKVMLPKIVIFDGEFATVDILAFLLHKNLKFLARKSRTTRVKEHFSTYYGTASSEHARKWRPLELLSRRYGNRRVNVEICPQNVHGEMKALIKSPEWRISPQYADKMYGRRFTIETGYRDKHKFKIFTCTKVLSSRLLFFLIAVLLWNCWQIFLIWVKSLKTYSKKLPRELLFPLTTTWIKYSLRAVFFSKEIRNDGKEVF